MMLRTFEIWKIARFALTASAALGTGVLMCYLSTILMVVLLKAFSLPIAAILSVLLISAGACIIIFLTAVIATLADKYIWRETFHG